MFSTFNSIRCEDNYKANGYLCIDIVSYPAPENVTAWFFSTTRIIRNSPQDPLIHQAIRYLFSRKLEVAETNLRDFAMLPLGDSNTFNWLESQVPMYSVQSQFEHMMALAVYSMAYRLFSLVALSVYHKMMQTNWHNATKFLTSLFIFSIPYVLMYSLLNYHATELLWADITQQCLIVLLSALPLKKLVNYLKELRMPSAYTHFHPVDFFARNIIEGMRNAGAMILYDHAMIGGLLRDGATDTCHFLSDRTYWPLCYNPITKNAILAPQLFDTKPYSLITDEIGSGIGKMFIDLLMFGLYNRGIVKDIRDPMAPLVNKIIKIVQSLVGYKDRKRADPSARIQANAQALRVTAEQQRQAKKAQSQPKKRENTSSSSSTSELHDRSYQREKFVPPVVSDKRRNQSSAPAAPQEQLDIRQIILKKELDRKSISIPSENTKNGRKIVPLSFKDRNSDTLPCLNLWGVIGDAHIVREKLHSFQTALNAGLIGARCNIVEDNQDKDYKLHSSDNSRLHGTIIEGEDAVYRALSQIFSVEEAVDMINQMKIEGHVNCLVFDKVAPKHKNG